MAQEGRRENMGRADAYCEAAWAFYGGVFRVVIPDNTKAIIATADPLHPRVVAAFREYAQASGFHVDPTRVRHPRDKGYASYCTSSVASAASLRRRFFVEIPFHVFRTGASPPGGS